MQPPDTEPTVSPRALIAISEPGGRGDEPQVRATVTARVFAKGGASAPYDYVLAKEDDFWRIAGVLRHEEKGETRL